MDRIDRLINKVKFSRSDDAVGFVSLQESGKWNASICRGGVYIMLGEFDDKDAAINTVETATSTNSPIIFIDDLMEEWLD